MAAAQRTPTQDLHAYLFSQVEIAGQTGNNERIHCKKCNHNFSGNAGRIHEHLISKPGSVKGCTFSETHDKQEVLDTIEELVQNLPKSNKRKALPIVVAPEASRTGRVIQMPIQQSMQAAGKQGVDQALADWVYEQGIPFNVFRSPSWQLFTQRLGKYGQGYTGPGYNRLRDKLLKGAVARLDAEMEVYWEEAQYTGITLMSDAWTDTSHRPLMNMLAATPKGSCFLFAENCSGEYKDGQFTADVWSKGMQRVGPENVSCLVADGAYVNTAAGKIFEEKYPHVTVVKCVAHSLDLMLEDMGKLPYFSGIIESEKRVVRFIMNHHYSLGLFRQFADKELLRTAETRFYGAHIVAERMLQLKAALQQTVVSQDWSDWAKQSTTKVKDEAAAVKALLLDEKDFWGRLEIMTGVFQPVVDLLRLTDSMVPAASKVYYYMSLLDGEIQKSALPQRLKPTVKDIVKKRWEYAHSDIHSAGFCLDPEFWHLNLNQEVRDGLYNICAKIVGEEKAIKCMLQLEAFRRREGCFGSLRALKMRDQMPAYQWWGASVSEDEAEELKTVALKILPMAGSAGGCERNWSTYDFITNRKRNRLDPTRAEQLVYVHYNRRCLLRSREPEQFASWLHEDVQLLPTD